ncbi:MAG: LptF/LptG family permease [Halanaerobiales bacterium]|nr:LptF/LptG family permease [Halanaerobiales bacterium]
MNKGKIFILNRYLFKELLQPILFCIFAVTIVFMSNFLFELSDLLINKRESFLTVIQMLFYQLPAIFVQTFPISTLFATVYSLGRLVKDNEITVMRTSGFGIQKIIIPFLILGLIVSFVSYWMNEKTVPWASHRSLNLVRQMMLRDVTPSIKEHVFFRGPDDRYFYVKNVDRTAKTLQGIMVYETQYPGKDTAFPRVITANKGVFNDNSWELEEGIINEFDLHGRIKNEVQFEELYIPVGDGLENFYGNQKTASEMSREELSEEINLFLKSGIKVDTWQVEYHMKMAIPFAPFIFVLVGAPLSLFNRKGWAVGIVLTLLVVFAYFILQSLCRSFGTGGMITAVWSAWLPNIIFAVLGILLLFREEFFMAR